MDIIRYFMRLEDKYWGLFLVALFVFWMSAQLPSVSGKNQKRLQFAALYGALGYLLIVCPLTYQILIRLGFEESWYYAAAYIWPVMFYLPLAGTFVFFALQDENGQKKWTGRQVYFVLGMLAILLATGKLAYFDVGQHRSVYGIYEPDQAQAYELVIRDAEENGFSEDMTIWGPYDWMAKSRIYDVRFVPIYGKDIADESAPYDPALRTLYRGYSAYEGEESLLLNKDQQLAAIAYFMDAFTEAPCRYVTVYDPRQQGANVDAESIFEQYGYRMVGQAGGLQVYCFLGKES